MERLVPSYTELALMRDSGMTHQQIADELSRRHGRRVARSTVSAAIHRSGELRVPRHRYDDTIPWTVPVAHAAEYPARMLRLLGRRTHGLPLRDEERVRLERWLAELEEREVIVAFCPNPPTDEPAFHYITAAAKDHDDPVPIRHQPVTPSSIGY